MNFFIWLEGQNWAFSKVAGALNWTIHHKPEVIFPIYEDLLLVWDPNHIDSHLAKQQGNESSVLAKELLSFYLEEKPGPVHVVFLWFHVIMKTQHVDAEDTKQASSKAAGRKETTLVSSSNNYRWVCVCGTSDSMWKQKGLWWYMLVQELTELHWSIVHALLMLSLLLWLLWLTNYFVHLSILMLFSKIPQLGSLHNLAQAALLDIILGQTLL